MKESKEQTGLFAYNAVIYGAYLKKNQLSLLAYYAVAYNWTEKKASFHSQETICRILDITPGTYKAARDDLERLGWISIEKKFRPGSSHPSVYVSVHCGKDDHDRVAKITEQRQRKAAKEKKLSELVDEEEFFGGRNPAEQKKYEDAIAHFNKHHDWLAKVPKFKNPIIPAVRQSARIQSKQKNGE